MPTVDSTLQIQTAASHGRALRLEFMRLTDRFVSTLWLVEAGRVRPVLRSQESADMDHWPPSPVIQEVMHHKCRDGPFLAGVGMAGNSHWSLAATLERDPRAIDLDVACRFQQIPEQLGSAYEAFHDFPVMTAEATWSTVVGSCIVVCQPQADGPAEGQLDAGEGRFSIRPAGLLEGDLPRTVRWKYRFSWRENESRGLLAEVPPVEET